MACDNRLETWWAGLPGEIQSVFGFAYDKADELLHAVAGDPDDLVRAGSVYARIGPQISALGGDVQADAHSLSAAWKGDSYTAFVARIDNLEQNMEAAADLTASTQEILNAAAQAAVDGANIIVDIVVTVIEFALGTLAIAAATAIISFGASMAAWVATELAEAAMALSRILTVVEKVAEVLLKVAQVLEKIAAILREIATIFMEWAKFVKGLKLLPQAWTADGVGLYISERIEKILIGKVDNLVGVPTLPSPFSKGIPSVVGDTGDLNVDVTRAENAR